MTTGKEEEVEWMTTSAESPSTSAASEEMATPQGASEAPETSPRSRPILAGSVSIAPTISIACFSRISLAMDAPMVIGPYDSQNPGVTLHVYNLPRVTAKLASSNSTNSGPFSSAARWRCRSSNPKR